MSTIQHFQLRKKRAKKYLRVNYYKKKRVGSAWRRAEGLHSKIRENRKGYPPKVKIGAGSPAMIKHMHYSGLKIKRVENLEQLGRINPDEEIVIIGKCVGKKNRVNILQKAVEMKIRILNVRNPELARKKIEDEFISRIKKKEPHETKKEKKPEIKKEVKAEEISPEEKKKVEKEERDKVLTKRQV